MAFTRYAKSSDNKRIHFELGRAQTGTDNGKWFDASECDDFSFTVSGTMSAGNWTVFGCNLIDKPADADNAHAVLQTGAGLNSFQTAQAYHWLKFQTAGVTGALDCGGEGRIQRFKTT